MVDKSKAPEVELDTDGVNEESVEIKETPKEPEATELPKEEVDLGYTEHNDKRTYEKEKDHGTDISFENERETKSEENKENKDEGELKDYSDKVQKRIKKLTFQVREAERKEKAALDYAKGLKDKYETAQSKFEETDTNYLKEYDARIDAQRDQVKANLKTAIESQDADKIMEANDALTKLAVEKEKVSMSLGEKEAKKKQSESETQQQTIEQPPISQKAQKWAEDNEWFGTDRVLTSAAMGIHEDLIQQGVASDSDEYYNQINKRMKEYFPQKFAQSSAEEETKVTPVQNVASVSRRSGGRKSVKLTKSQVVIAKKLGVPLEEYAKYVKEGA
tara:strand:+ start:1592 stop:2590 length:999 start_codon:yes stop_codon:yes gene_type:complete